MTNRKKPEEKKPVGRKSQFKGEYIELAYNYSLLGAIDKEMADLFNVSEQTLNTWKKHYPEFLESIKKGKTIADAGVALKLFKRAVGYDYEELHVEKKGRKVVLRRTVNKHMPADTTAQIFWLKNRQPEKWRDKQDVDLKAEVTGSMPITEWLKLKGNKRKNE